MRFSNRLRSRSGSASASPSTSTERGRAGVDRLPAVGDNLGDGDRLRVADGLALAGEREGVFDDRLDPIERVGRGVEMR